MHTHSEPDYLSSNLADYHDHNWMNKGMAHLVDHWYWGQGKVGPFTFITANIVLINELVDKVAAQRIRDNVILVQNKME